MTLKPQFEKKEEFLDKINKSYMGLDKNRLSTLKSLFYFIDQIEDFRCKDLKNHQLSEGRAMVLVTIWTAGKPINSSEIAQNLNVTRATLTGLSDSLVKDQLIERINCIEDRRVCYLALTKKGEKLIESIMPEHFQRIKKLMDCLSPKEAVVLNDLLHKLISNMVCEKSC